MILSYLMPLTSIFHVVRLISREPVMNIATLIVGCLAEDDEKQGRQAKRCGDINCRRLPRSGKGSHYHFNGPIKLKERGNPCYISHDNLLSVRRGNTQNCHIKIIGYKFSNNIRLTDFFRWGF